MSISCGAPCIGWRAGMAAAALPTDVGCGCGDAGAGSGFLPSSSRMSAPSPRPSAFLAIMDHLFRKMRVALCPFALGVIKNDGLPKTRRLCQTNVARNDAFEDLVTEEGAQVVRYLARQGGSLVVHRQQDSFDFEVGIQSATNAHERVQ